MKGLRFELLSLDGRGARLDDEFGVGVAALTSSDEKWLAALHLAISGTSTARRGRVLWNGEDPARTPRLRARLGTLFPEEMRPETNATVRTYLRAVEGARARFAGTRAPSDDHSPRFFPTTWLDRPVALLDPSALRGVALEVAASVIDPIGFSLHDPLGAVEPEFAPRVLDFLTEIGRKVPVLVTTTNRRDAEKLAARVVLPRGATEPPDDGASLVLRVERPRELAAELTKSPDVLGTSLDPRRPDTLVVRGTDVDALARVVGDGIRKTRVDVFEMTRGPTAVEPPRSEA